MRTNSATAWDWPGNPGRNQEQDSGSQRATAAVSALRRSGDDRSRLPPERSPAPAMIAWPRGVRALGQINDCSDVVGHPLRGWCGQAAGRHATASDTLAQLLDIALDLVQSDSRQPLALPSPYRVPPGPQLEAELRYVPGRTLADTVTRMTHLCPRRHCSRLLASRRRTIRTSRCADYRRAEGGACTSIPPPSTPGCTKQACDFRDNLAEFNDAGFAVVEDYAPDKLRKAGEVSRSRIVDVPAAVRPRRARP